MTDHRRKNKVPFVAPIRLRNLLWLVVLGSAWLAAYQFGTPHLRVRYTWSGPTSFPVYHACTYWGLHSFELVPRHGECPPVLFVRETRS
jgi:hypothetical protein